MSLLSKLAGIPAHIAARIAAAHLPSQVARFLRIAAFAAISGVAAHLVVSGAVAVPIAAVLAGALETAFRQAWPSVPLGTIVDAVKATAPAAKNTPLSASATPAAPAPVSSAPIPKAPPAS